MIFQKIINREVPSDIVYEDDYLIAFKDVNHKAKVHVLIVPKDSSIQNLNDINKGNIYYIEKIFLAVPSIAASLGLTDYKLLTNCGRGAGQEIFHLHFHLMGGGPC